LNAQTILRQATVDDIDILVPLFDAYRVFYGQESDFVGAKKFLLERFSNNENVVFLAYHDTLPAGFTQLYSTFSSVSMRPFYILNDLFVLPNYRQQGLGAALLQKAQQHCAQMGYKGVALETASDNPAQQLYEKMGWKKEDTFLHYFWACPNTV